MSVSVQGLGKSYRVYPNPRARLFELLSGRQQHREQWALADISFSLNQGDCLGIVGDNGAGKSTLLKLIAGTLHPSAGSLHKNGRLTAILELGAGFHPDFTGRENLYFGGSLMGLTRAQMGDYEQSIIDFAELGPAIDRPVKTYSSGMVVRLAFALATAVEPEILIIDEALSVGDQHFQKKSIERINHFREMGCTILFCSHSLYHVRQICNRALWIREGRAAAQGDTEAVLATYDMHVRALDPATSAPLDPSGPAVDPETTVAKPPLPPTHLARLRSVTMNGLALGPDAPKAVVARNLEICLSAEARPDLELHFGVLIERQDGVWVTGTGTHITKELHAKSGTDGRCGVCVEFEDLPLLTGGYRVSAYLFDGSGLVVFDEWLGCGQFEIHASNGTMGLVRLPHRWRLLP